MSPGRARSRIAAPTGSVASHTAALPPYVRDASERLVTSSASTPSAATAIGTAGRSGSARAISAAAGTMIGTK